MSKFFVVSIVAEMEYPHYFITIRLCYAGKIDIYQITASFCRRQYILSNKRQKFKTLMLQESRFVTANSSLSLYAHIR